jgi:hypothetical protein
MGVLKIFHESKEDPLTIVRRIGQLDQRANGPETFVAYLRNHLFREMGDELSAESLMIAFEKPFSGLNIIMKADASPTPHLSASLLRTETSSSQTYTTDPSYEPLTLYHPEGARYGVER